MTITRRGFQFATASALLVGAVPALAQAQAWPDKPVKLLLSQPPGSGPDTMARLIGEQLARRWGQPAVVENRPGGQNVIGAQAAARAPADGYTFYFATAAALVTNAYLIKNLPYDPLKDFVPGGMVGKVPFVLSAGANSSAKSLQDFVAQAKANPGKLNVANEGPKTFGGMMTRVAAQQLGVQVNAVPYVSVSAAVTDVVGGQVEFLMSDMPSAAAMFKAGRLRPLAVTTAKRLSGVPGLESVPALAETVPGFDYAGWLAIMAPTGTPAAALARFNRDLDAVLQDKDIAARIATIGPLTEGAGTPEQLGAFLRAEHTRWARLSQELGIVAE